MKHWQPALAILAALYASLALADDFKTINGKEYKDATVSRVEPNGIMLKFHGGIAKIFFVELPPEIQKQYGYDAVAAMRQQARPADLMSQAESALRAGQFGKGAELLNQIVTGYPTGPQAKSVRDLRSLLREKEPTQDGPLTANEAQRLRALMDQEANIKRNYHTTTPERQRALETILGADALQDTNNGLDSLSSFMTKLRDSRDKALGGE
jgi:hypothetical protein